MPRSVLEEAGSYLRSPFTPLLLFVPMGLVLAHHGEGINPLFVFLANGLAIVPLANLISNSVETLSEHLGDQWGGCLNATFGNLVELVIAYSALTGGLYEVVLDGLVGGLVRNLLLVLGLSAVMMVAFVPSALDHLNMFSFDDHHDTYSVLLAILLLASYGLSYVYQFFTHGELFTEMPKPFDQEVLSDTI